MAKKKQEFRPDPSGAGLMSKLYITPTQRKKIYRWAAYSALCIALLVVQEVILSRFQLYGGIVDLAPAIIVLVCVMEGAENGGVFALAASVFYYYSGAAPGAYCIALITLGAVAMAAFRQEYLRRGFGSDWFCTAVAVLVYQAGVFGVALFMENSRLDRWISYVMNFALSMTAVPLVHPLFGAIRKIGGETWKE